MLFHSTTLRFKTVLLLGFSLSLDIFQLVDAGNVCADEYGIRMTQANLALLVDTKQFSSLDQIYTTDAIADFGYPVGTLTGVTAIEAGLTKLLANIDTLHTLAQSVIYVSEDEVTKEREANVTTSFTLPHFGRGKYYGQLFTAWGRYEDVMIQNGNDTNNGQEGWMIKYRKINYVAPFIGNLSITGH